MFIFLILSQQVSWAATDCATQVCRYVREGGSGNGTDWNNAYGSLPTTLVRGAVYFIADGSYPDYTFNTAASGTALITIKKAIENDHGTDVGWSKLYGDGQAAFTGGFEFTTSYWLIDGQTGGGAENSWLGDFGFKITDKSDTNALIKIGWSGTTNNITLRHLDMEGKGSAALQGGSYSNDGVALYGGNNFTLSYFHMKGIGRGPFFMSGQNVIVEHGWVESFFGSEEVHSEIASLWAFDGTIGNMTFRYNLFTDVQSTGGIMWDNSSNKSAVLAVYGNVFYRPSGASWSNGNGVVGGWTSNSSFYNAKVYNNSFININIASLSSLPQDYGSNEAYNNIFYNCATPDFSKFPSHDSNLFINSGTAQGEANGKTASTNPFMNITELDFRLTAATAAGKTFASPFNLDPYQIARGSDGVYDRGAFEFGGVAVTPTPTPIPTATPVATATPTPVPTATPAATPAIVGETLLGTSAPTTLDANDGVAYELGMKFSSISAGQITALRFYKSPSETGTHTGKIYSSTGALLASVTFEKESASGWQITYLASPLAISANTTYTVSVNTGAGFYALSAGDFAAQKSSANLIAPVSAGVYGAAGAMPTSSWSNTNYLRDVVFVKSGTANPTPTPPSTATPAPTATPVPTASPTPVATDLTPPSAAITSPTDGTRVARHSTVTISASANDNVGVTKVEFYVNGILKCTDTSAPHTCSWAVPRSRNVPYILQVKAYDAAGNAGSSAIISVTSR
jgi:hypothetical protein